MPRRLHLRPLSVTRGVIHVGTSGWHYPHWVGPFYPEGSAPREFLAHYVRRFRTVEINNTFYRLPAPATIAEWRDATPAGFVFACKASRFITHMKKLAEPGASIGRFFATVAILGSRLGPILFQLPPRWRVDEGRLGAFLEALPGGYRYAFEFRDRSWFSAAVERILSRHGAALCAYELGGWRSPVRVTADFTYVRLHGPAGPYQGRYDGRALAGWARRFAGWRDAGLDVYCYLDNDEAGHAVLDALRLAAMVAGRR